MNPALPSTPTFQIAERDFGDWWNPLWVKECRQGLRNRLFVCVFTGIQIAMMIVVSFQVLYSIRGEAGDFLRFMFWFCLVFILHALPLIGAVIKRDEDCKPRMMDLLKVAGMTGDAVAMNKFKVQLSQTALILTSVLPYLLVRYFAGGVNIVEEIVSLGWLTIGAACVGYLSVLVSTFNFTGRVVVGMVLVVCFPLFEWFLWYSAELSAGGFNSESIPVFALWLMFGFTGLFMCLGIAGSNYDSLQE